MCKSDPGRRFEDGLLVIDHPQPSAADLRRLSREELTYGVTTPLQIQDDRPSDTAQTEPPRFEIGVLVDPDAFRYKSSVPWRPYYHGLRRHRWER